MCVCVCVCVCARVCVCAHAQLLSCIWLLATPWTVAYQAPLSVGFSWQEYWSGLPVPPSGDLSNPGKECISPVFPTLQANITLCYPCIYLSDAMLLYAMLSHFSRVRLCVTVAYQAPPSLGFSRQEHWSGLPFPSPMHESEKWKWSRSVESDSAIPWTAGYQAPPSMGFSRQEYWSGVYDCILLCTMYIYMLL